MDAASYPRQFASASDIAQTDACGVNQIRQYGGGTPIIVLPPLEAIARIGEHIRGAAQHRTFSEQLDVSMTAARERVQRRYGDTKVPDAFDRERSDREVKLSLDRWHESNQPQRPVETPPI